MPNRSILHPNVEDPASQPASPRLGHPKPGQALILSFLLCRGSRSYPPFPILAGPPDPAGGRERAPCTASRGPAPPLPLPPPQPGRRQGAWVSPAREGAALLLAEARASLAGSALSAASRPPASHFQMPRSAPGRPCPDVPLPLRCPAASFAERRPDVPALVRRRLTRSRCAAWPGPVAATKGEGGPGREEPGCSWTLEEECAGKDSHWNASLGCLLPK